jgi:hypothetical protein
VLLTLAITVTCGCIAASGRRLAYVLGLTTIDSGALVAALRHFRGAGRGLPLPLLRESFLELPGADWERELVTALADAGPMRAALVGEAMTELDFRAKRWSGVPRVAASLASSFGFLLATVVVRVGLSGLAGGLDDGEVGAVDGTILDALDVAAVGLVGAAICIAIHFRSRALLPSRLLAAEQLVELLEGWEEEATPLATRGDHDSVDARPSSASPLTV